MKKFILAFISIIFSFSTLADVDKRFVKKRMMGRDLNSREGKGPTPVAFFENKSPQQTELGQKVNLDKFFIESLSGKHILKDKGRPLEGYWAAPYGTS